MRFLLLIIIFAVFSNGYAQSTTELPNDVSTTTLSTTTSIPIYFLSDYQPEISWQPHSTDSIIIEADEGYKISINVTECDIDGEQGEYATISADESTEGLTFTYSLSAEHTYLYNTNKLFANFYGTNASNFTAIFSRVGEPLTTTTTEIPTTTIFLPSPSENDSSVLVVYLDGKTPYEYDEKLVQQLRDSIVVMATEYCDNENFPLNGTITSSNVVIHKLGRCPLNWPDFETCAELNFSVPVNLLENSHSLWTGYQMTTEHLRIMWDRYASSELPDGITYYFDPDMSSLKWGIVIATVVIVVFVLIMGLLRFCCARISKRMRRRKLSDTTTIISQSDRNSQASLPPHYLQETPPLFENAYPMYNPDKGTTYTEPSFAKSHDYQGYQDLSVQIKKQADGEDEEESGA